MASNPITFQFFAEGMLKETGLDVLNRTFKYTTSVSGLHEVCFTNRVRDQTKVSFDFLVGQKAQDWGSITQLSDIEILTAQAKHAANQVYLLENEVNMTVDRFRERRDLEYSVSHVSLYLSLIFVVVIGVLLYIQFSVIRKHLEKRKFT